MTPLVLIHGGGFDSRCWDLLLPHLDVPAIAVDLPGRGAHPAPLNQVTFGLCAECVADDIDRAGFDEVVLVGHSLAGCSMPATIALLGDRVRHAVFLGCTVPEDGCSAFDTLEPEIQAIASSAPPDELGVLASDVARIMFGNDMTDEQFAWCVERMVPEAPHLTYDKVDLAPLRGPFAKTWVLTLHDAVVSAAKQRRFARNVGDDCAVVELDAAHMSMISRPAETAAVLNALAA